jgi:hypothetical protein
LKFCSILQANQFGKKKKKRTPGQGKTGACPICSANRGRHIDIIPPNRKTPGSFLAAYRTP